MAARRNWLAALTNRRRDLGSLLLGVWLAAMGVRSLIALNFLFADQILGLLALAAGVAILLKR